MLARALEALAGALLGGVSFGLLVPSLFDGSDLCFERAALGIQTVDGVVHWFLHD